MKAVVVESPGGIDALQYKTDHPTPAVPEGHALIRNEFAGLNFIDTYHRSGLYPRRSPFVLGTEGVGTIAKLSSPQHGLKVGDRVVYGAAGSYAEYTSVPVDKLIPVPDGLDTQTAVACMTQGLTAHYLSSSVGAGVAKPEDWVLVYSVGSGTGQWTAQMCKLRGYRVIGTTSRAKVESFASEDDAAAAFGCEKLIVLDNAPGKSYASYSSVDISSEVAKATSGKGCKLVIDGVGKSTYEISLKCLTKRGLFVSFGNASGAVPAFPVLKLLPQSAYVTRPKLNDYIATREELMGRVNEVFSWVRDGKLKITVDRVFGLDEAATGHKYMEEGKSKGKILFKL
mmetsp:Transcript_20986/g.44919  ORF Transcript_20986/g.44919 Transcript_20986/m.44919 type:complete len:341 (+) Transcript_20986:111-1133(+)|eukprot:CAMPEP_0172566810 /NCGR_PEP_ID=MMETSP1067-20121228/113341_1 /TAXON_ID=265564 ORGANISM="Thalassiosira punctigera, Strain Tpunct2005C2" /NCGR_SAMPLE_ID=MMETSP1067 /ASSEMBLY_ACC=CAM_ASM_000444 /LENGTH=340 /DNA_ID=CAMNT_0013358013 /DNA_START=82 /DNA_END=1104 /DNA_ORIENTATION=+